MEAEFEHLSDGELLTVIGRALDVLLSDRTPPPDDRGLLALLRASLGIGARLEAWQSTLAARAEATEAAWHEHGTSTSTWLSDAANLTRREAARLVSSGQGLQRFAAVGRALAEGSVLPGQAGAITGVLDGLSDDLPAGSLDEAEQLMLGFAASHNATELRRLGHRLLEVLDPVGAEQRDAVRLEREHRLAMRSRHLTFTHNHHGSVLFHGSLPSAEAEPFLRIIDAYAAAARRGLDRIDPAAEHLTPAMWRADALLAMVAQHCQQSLAPSHGGDRPRVVVTVSYETLATATRNGGLLAGTAIGGREPVPASVLRRWLCDADVLPAVLGGASEVLDVGRAQRLVTPPIRAALEVRDDGCVFPGCDKPPSACHAHHIVPWWAGGRTALDNLLLVCAHHHGIVEPGHDPTADRWQARLGADGMPEVLPPLRVDPRRRPRRHARFLNAVRR